MTCRKGRGTRSDQDVAMGVQPDATASRVFAQNLVGLGFVQSVSHIKSVPTHEKKKKKIAAGKSGPKCHFLT